MWISTCEYGKRLCAVPSGLHARAPQGLPAHPRAPRERAGAPEHRERHHRSAGARVARASIAARISAVHNDIDIPKLLLRSLFPNVLRRWASKKVHEQVEITGGYFEAKSKKTTK